LLELGPTLPSTDSERTQVLWNMVIDFSETYKNSIKGKYDRLRKPHLANSGMSGGAEIKSMFYDLLEE